MTFTPLPFNQIPTVTSVPAGSQIICVVGGNLRRADFSLLPKGDPGEQGEQGPAGSSINLLGTLDNEAQLPTDPTPINGDAYFIGTNLWVYTVDEWVDTGSFQGEPGTPVEFQTADGFLQYRVVGDAEWINLVSITEFQGNSISAASGVPNNANGNDGDLYINVTNGDLYQKTGGVWGVIGNLTGPPGNDADSAIPSNNLVILNGSNTYFYMDMSELLADMVQGENRYLGKYVISDSTIPNEPVELEIFLDTESRRFTANLGQAWFEVDLHLTNFDPAFGSGVLNRLVRLTLKDNLPDGSGMLSINANPIVFPINPEGSSFSSGVGLNGNQELRIDNTAFATINPSTLRASINAYSYLRLMFFKPENSPYFYLNCGEANPEALFTFFDSTDGSSGSYYGY